MGQSISILWSRAYKLSWSTQLEKCRAVVPLASLGKEKGMGVFGAALVQS